MHKPSAEPGLAQAFVELRRSRLSDALRRPLGRVGEGAEPLSAQRIEFLRREAEDLFWNELSWEELTDEELIPGGHLTELVFPGLLAFVDGLLVERAPLDSVAPARPHPDAVEEILLFLAEQASHFAAKLENGADSKNLVWARTMTARLVDLVLYRLHRVGPSELEEIDALE